MAELEGKINVLPKGQNLRFYCQTELFSATYQLYLRTYYPKLHARIEFHTIP